MRVQSVFAMADAMRPVSAPAPVPEVVTPPAPAASARKALLGWAAPKKKAEPKRKKAPTKKVARPAPRKRVPQPSAVRSAVPMLLDHTQAASKRLRVLNDLIEHLARIKAALKAALSGDGS